MLSPNLSSDNIVTIGIDKCCRHVNRLAIVALYNTYHVVRVPESDVCHNPSRLRKVHGQRLPRRGNHLRAASS